MNDIKIFPIFNQNVPEIQDDFKRVRTITMKYNYNASLIEDSDPTYQPKSTNRTFAFGAYDNNTMVGYVNGNFIESISEIERLFVLPEYQKQNIGTRLLRSAESAMSLYTRQMSLGAIWNAVDFYKKHGYTQYTCENVLKKTIAYSGRSCLSPVFLPNATIFNQIAKLSDTDIKKFDSRLLAKSHTPVFVYRDANCKIQGYYIHGDTPDFFINKLYSPLVMQKQIQKFIDFTNSKSR